MLFGLDSSEGGCRAIQMVHGSVVCDRASLEQQTDIFMRRLRLRGANQFT